MLKLCCGFMSFGSMLCYDAVCWQHTDMLHCTLATNNGIEGLFLQSGVAIFVSTNPATHLLMCVTVGCFSLHMLLRCSHKLLHTSGPNLCVHSVCVPSSRLRD